MTDRERRGADKTEGQPAERKPPRYPDRFIRFQCIHSRRWNYVYTINYRCASTTIRAALVELETGESAAEIVADKGQAADIRKQARDLVGRLPEDPRPELRRLIADDSVFMFSFVRNPYERLASAYASKIANDKQQAEPVREWLTAHGRDASGIISFDDFLYYLEGANLAKVDVHWQRQSRLLLEGLMRYDRIGHMERFERDWPEIFERIGGGEYHGPHLNRQTATQPLLEGLSGTERKRIAALYARDFELFGYPR